MARLSEEMKAAGVPITRENIAAWLKDPVAAAAAAKAAQEKK